MTDERPTAVFGMLNVNKPSGPTSHDIVADTRRRAGVSRVGHAGTLDPLAAGVLVLALGVTTDTYDREGRITDTIPLPPDLSPQQVEHALGAFLGDIQQVPPAYSAIKVRGRAAYARSRTGESLTLEARPVTIYDLSLLAFEPPTLTLAITCSAGTYIRSLAHDLGQALGCGAMLSALTRTASGPFVLEDAIEWSALQAAFRAGDWRSFLIPPDFGLDHLPSLVLNQDELDHFAHGRPVSGHPAASELCRVYDPEQRLIGIVQGDPDRGVWIPRKVLTGQLFV